MTLLPFHPNYHSLLSFFLSFLLPSFLSFFLSFFHSSILFCLLISLFIDALIYLFIYLFIHFFLFFQSNFRLHVLFLSNYSTFLPLRFYSPSFSLLTFSSLPFSPSSPFTISPSLSLFSSLFSLHHLLSFLICYSSFLLSSLP